MAGREKSVRAGLGGRDLILLGLLLLPVLSFVLPALCGRTFFWGDLLYLHHPWRALPAEMIQRGMLPLWNPYSYLGMPLAAQMQSAVWYPGTLPFYLFGFETALPIFHVLHYWLAGAFGFLWLRSWGFSRAAAFGAAAAFMLSGGLVRDLPFLNHLSTLAYMPAFLLFARRPLILALSMALAFLSGYPQMLAGSAAAAWLITAAIDLYRRRRSALKTRLEGLGRHTARWAGAGLLAMGLAGVLLLPAVELVGRSRRSAGVEDAKEAMTFSLSGRDLIQFTAPPLIPGEEYSPAYQWWKTVYWGILGLGAAALGLAGLSGSVMAAAAAYLIGAVLLMLGSTNPLSEWIWAHLPLVNYIRYPGNTSYLAVPVVMLLIASALHRRRWAVWAALAITAELFVYSLNMHPTVPRGFFTEPGPLVGVLRREIGSHRYLISPLALNWSRGKGAGPDAAARDLGSRLYGVTNMPVHLSAVANFGEPLVPRRNYAFMDFLYTRPGLAGVRPWLGWADAAVLMTRDRMPPAGFRYLGESLWHLYRNPERISRAVWFDEKSGARIPRGLDGDPPPLSSGRPLEVESPREDRLAVSGDFKRPGWLYLAEPLGPGWEGELISEEGGADPEGERALSAFWRLRVPKGPWRFEFRYAPASFRIGLLLSLLSMLLLSAVGFRRLSVPRSAVRG